MSERDIRHTSMDVEALLEQLPDGAMKTALREQAPSFAAELLRDYFAADEVTRADMRAFFDSEGPRRVHESKLRITDGVPTSAQLASWSAEG